MINNRMLQDKFSYLKTLWEAFKRWSKMGKRGNIKKRGLIPKTET